MPLFQSDPYVPIPGLTPQAADDTLVSSLSHLSTACVWHRYFWKSMTGTSTLTRNILMSWSDTAANEQRWFSYRSVLSIYHIYLVKKQKYNSETWNCLISYSSDLERKILCIPSSLRYRRSSVILDKRIFSRWPQCALHSIWLDRWLLSYHPINNNNNNVFGVRFGVRRRHRGPKCRDRCRDLTINSWPQMSWAKFAWRSALNCKPYWRINS